MHAHARVSCNVVCCVDVQVIDISNSFEISWSLDPHGLVVIDTAFLQHKMEQCK